MTKKIKIFIKEYQIIIYTFLVFIYWEILNSNLIFGKYIFNGLFPVFIALIMSIILYILISIIPKKFRTIAFVMIIFTFILLYMVYYLYYKIFQTPLSLYSLSGAGDALQFREVAINTIKENFISVMLFIAPILAIKFLDFKTAKIDKRRTYSFMILLTLLLTSTFTLANSTSSNKTVYKLFNEINDPDLNLQNLGLIQTILLDFNRAVLGNEIKIDKPKPPTTEISKPDPIKKEEYNILNIDFENLVNLTLDNEVKDMHRYFSSQLPTEKHKYTGMFKDHNLILITAEALHPTAISKELTPILYKMTNEGFVFNNFYNPLWGVSTIDGEYAACTGLLPKTGVWSLSESAKNNMMFTLGNQLKQRDYATYAYHNHTYSYYNRDESHPNLGYDYYGIGNGLKIKDMWPRSDLEMIEVTAPMYVNNEPFHAYYMTVSGHLEYNFNGNHIAKKNKDFVSHLPYSDSAKAYLACNLELEFALEKLIKMLDEEGVLNNTVIAISPDHYPYGLTLDEINELSKTKITNDFELFKSTLIIWEEGMSKIEVDKLCSSVDILPTLLNLFGIEFDSRLLIGKDILSDYTPIVVFKNHSWITNFGYYDSEEELFHPKNEDISSTYIENINKVVKEKFYYSAKILEKDYYSYIYNALN
jgi:phosphoglycerol transferase MdoB-like AlkP superfamily enzyme